MTHPNTDQGVTAEDREAAQRIWHMCDDGPYCELPNWLIQSFARHRLSSTAALEAEIASLKKRLESAEEVINLALACTPHGRIRNPGSPLPIIDIIYDCGDPWEILRAFPQEQEKQNG